MPEVSAGSNQVGANVTLLPHVTCPCGPAAPVEPVQRRTLEPVSRAENFRSSRRLRSPAEQVAILIPLGSLKRDDFSSNRHRPLTFFWSMIFPETGTHFSGSCSRACPQLADSQVGILMIHGGSADSEADLCAGMAYETTNGIGLRTFFQAVTAMLG